VIMDNLSAHKGARIRAWAKKHQEGAADPPDTGRHGPTRRSPGHRRMPSRRTPSGSSDHRTPSDHGAATSARAHFDHSVTGWRAHADRAQAVGERASAT
jgi:hypothetical protein